MSKKTVALSIVIFGTVITAAVTVATATVINDYAIVLVRNSAHHKAVHVQEGTNCMLRTSKEAR